uniref:sterol regulatory element-binding protein cleavage-activating protein isoform X3 n=1 Tax=Myxine glutinosa TaxID=7769 RepID=UPI00358EEEE0
METLGMFFFSLTWSTAHNLNIRLLVCNLRRCLLGVRMPFVAMLKDKISRAFYSHGLMCASYPVPIISFTTLCVLVCCYPLLKLPLPGTGPLEFVSSEKANSALLDGIELADYTQIPSWYVGSPVAYVQQVIVKAMVSPWEQSLIPADAFRAPLSKVFEVIDEIRNHQQRTSERSVNIEDFCLKVSSLLPGLRKLQNFLPEHSCLIVSPANFWQNDLSRFRSDPDIVHTMNQHQTRPFQFSTSLKDLLFGVPPKYGGVSQYYVRERKRVLVFAITIILQAHDSQFVQSLRKKLQMLYPGSSVSRGEASVVHVHFQEEVGIAELVPLVTTYVILFAYIYFSTRKIDMVKSKWGLALAAVATVVSSLLISVGLCTLFGLTPTLNGGEIFPYLVLVIGLENILVLTKSVVSTPVDLDVKIRIAQGLSNESWSIVKTMASELVIVLIGYFTMVPAIQEFCLFAVVGIVSDFFLQMFFFTTVLAVDIRRMELSDLARRPLRETSENLYGLRTRTRSKSVWNRDGFMTFPCNIPLASSSLRTLRLPRRLRVVYFLARTRLAQRIIMIGTVIWIGLLVYTDPTGLRAYIAERVSQRGHIGDGDFSNMALAGFYAEQTDVAGVKQETAFPTTNNIFQLDTDINPQEIVRSNDAHNFTPPLPDVVETRDRWEGFGRDAAGSSRPDSPYMRGPDRRAEITAASGAKRARGSLKVHAERDLPKEILWDKNDDAIWRRLSFRHWPTLFSYYNVSLASKYISILPSIPLLVTLSADFARSLQHPNEVEQHKMSILHEQSKITEAEPACGKTQHPPTHGHYRAAGLGFILGAVLVGLTCALYKLLCPKDYGQAGHLHRFRPELPCDDYGFAPAISETLPIVLMSGHPLDIECVAANGSMLVTCCLSGSVMLWDALTGELLSVFPRQTCRAGESTWLSESDTTERGQRESVESESVQEFCHGETEILTDFDFAESPLNVDSPHVSPHLPFNFTFSVGTTVGDLRHQNFASAAANNLSDASFSSQRTSLTHRRRCRSPSGDSLNFLGTRAVPGSPSPSGTEAFEAGVAWCLAMKENIIALGCGNGQLEVWDAAVDGLHCKHQESSAGIIHLVCHQKSIVAARIDGMVDFFLLENSNLQNQTWRGDMGSVRPSTDISLRLMHSVCPAHRKPITALRVAAGRVVTASEDHTLKVTLDIFKLEDSCCLFTLRGHQAGVTTAYMDQSMTLASGGRDGIIFLWDALTGSKVNHMRGHHSSILSITCTPNYVVSAGTDYKTCIWDRQTALLLYSIPQEPGCSPSFGVVSDSLLVTCGLGCLNLWEMSYGRLVQTVYLSRAEEYELVHQILVVGNSTIACHMGKNINLVCLPSVLDKID